MQDSEQLNTGYRVFRSYAHLLKQPHPDPIYLHTHQPTNPLGYVITFGPANVRNVTYTLLDQGKHLCFIKQT